MKKNVNSDVPIETVMRHIIRERDHYKEKLAQLVPYTKRLEEKVAGYEAIFKRAEEENSEDNIYSLRIRLMAARKEYEAMRKDFKRSEWYKSLMGEIEHHRKQNRILRDTIYELREQIRNENDFRRDTVPCAGGAGGGADAGC